MWHHRVFLLDTLNFCFWADKDEELFRVSHKGREWTGYLSLCAALARAVEVRYGDVGIATYTNVPIPVHLLSSCGIVYSGWTTDL